MVDVEVSPEEATVISKALGAIPKKDNGTPESPLDESPHPLEHIFVHLHSDPILDPTEQPPDVLAVTEMTGVVFSQGVNEMQSMANSVRSTYVQEQHIINMESLQRILKYCQKYESVFREMYMSGSVHVMSARSARDSKRRQSLQSHPAMRKLGEVQRKRNEAKDAIEAAMGNQMEKHVYVLVKTSVLCKELAGVYGILCKSGKDRTSMSSTLEIARALTEDLGVSNGVDVCHLLRNHGVRRMNVWANTGQPFFAFNNIQVRYLPDVYKPPAGTFSGSVNS